MNFEELKIRFIEGLTQRWNEIQESSAYLQFKERYEELPGVGQQLFKIACALVIGLLLLATPLTWLDSANNFMTDFDAKRSLTRDLLHLRRESQQGPQLPFAPSATDLKTQADGVIQSLQLLPEQIKSVEINTFQSERGSEIPTHVVQSGVVVTVEKLNLKQVAELTFRLQSISELVKVTALDIKAASPDPHYLDVMLRLVAFQPPASTGKK